MIRWWLSSTSAFALLVFGGGRSVAAPMVSTDALLSSALGQSDVVRQSLSLGVPEAPQAAGNGARETGAVEQRPVADPTASTPSVTFTFRPSPAPRGDTGLPAAVPVTSRRNPGNVSNLRGTIGTDDAGIFSVPAAGIEINGSPARVYNYIFRPNPRLAETLDAIEPGDVIARPPLMDTPAHSVFIGVRSPVGDAEHEQAAREASIISATGSTAPTVMISPLPGGSEPARGLAYALDAGAATTIGFSTASIQPTRLPPGSAATTTLGYTYTPVGRGPTRDLAAPDRETLSATITAPNGGPAGRDRFDRRDVPSGSGAMPIAASTVSATIPPVRSDIAGAAADTFVIARSGADGHDRGPERVTIPILVKGDIAEATSSTRSIFDSDTIETGAGSVYARYGLAAAVILVPIALAVLGFRIVRRAALRRLG